MSVDNFGAPRRNAFPGSIRTADCGGKTSSSRMKKSEKGASISQEQFERVQPKCKNYTVAVNGSSIDLYVTPKAMEVLSKYSSDEPDSQRDLLNEDGPTDTLCGLVARNADIYTPFSLAGCTARQVEKSQNYIIVKAGESLNSGRRSKA